MNRFGKKHNEHGGQPTVQVRHLSTQSFYSISIGSSRNELSLWAVCCINLADLSLVQYCIKHIDTNYYKVIIKCLLTDHNAIGKDEELYIWSKCTEHQSACHHHTTKDGHGTSPKVVHTGTADRT